MMIGMRRPTPETDAWATAPDPLLALAERELTFYQRAVVVARRAHRAIELGALASASATVVTAGLHAPAWVTTIVAGGALFCTGFRQVFTPGPRWVLAAQSRESLRRAVNRYRLLPASERDAQARAQLLAAIEEVGTQHVSQWAGSHREQTLIAGAPPPTQTPPT
ncbi:SLATT domain-containing protein [Streptomyces sp. NPDC002952]|uniref:SLATT domain-containing protein n=1 Tax=Streptomyces sp. NPDC002952 TaxID=3364673 RepID=UPI0036CD94B3